MPRAPQPSKPAVIVGVALAAACCTLTAASASQSESVSAHRQASDPAVLILKRRIEHHEPVPIDPNVGVQFQDGGRVGTYDAPLDYPIHGKTAWFGLQQNGDSIHSLQVVPIKSLGTTREHLAGNPSVVSVTHEAVIAVSPITHEPAATIRLSNGQRELVAIGQGSASQIVTSSAHARCAKPRVQRRATLG